MRVYARVCLEEDSRAAAHKTITEVYVKTGRLVSYLKINLYTRRQLKYFNLSSYNTFKLALILQELVMHIFVTMEALVLIPTILVSRVAVLKIVMAHAVKTAGLVRGR